MTHNTVTGSTFLENVNENLIISFITKLKYIIHFTFKNKYYV